MKVEKVLLRTVLYLHHRLERDLTHGEFPLSLSQYRLLFMIQEGPARSVELATASRMTKPSIGALVSQLDEKGWIERSGLKADRRASSIQITAAGREMISDFESKMQAVLQEFLGRDVVSKADKDFTWLFDAWLEKRDQAHDQWALRKTTSVGDTS